MLTVATQITIFRILLVPGFVVLAVRYADTLHAGTPNEFLRWTAIISYIICGALDALDGYIARSRNQFSKLGAILDPLADKLLLISGIVTLSVVEWGVDGWRIPLWFTGLVLLREIIILGGIAILYSLNKRVPIIPHWSGKLCTITQMVAVGWTMLKPVPLSPLYPAIIAAVFTVWSGYAYIMQGVHQLPRNGGPPEDPHS